MSVLKTYSYNIRSSISHGAAFADSELHIADLVVSENSGIGAGITELNAGVYALSFAGLLIENPLGHARRCSNQHSD